MLLNIKWKPSEPDRTLLLNYKRPIDYSFSELYFHVLDLIPLTHLSVTLEFWLENEKIVEYSQVCFLGPNKFEGASKFLKCDKLIFKFDQDVTFLSFSLKDVY